MLIDLNHAAGILASTDDEVMFMVQSGDLTSHIDEELMQWKFDITEVLGLKAKIDQAKQMIEEKTNASNTAFTDGD